MEIITIPYSFDNYAYLIICKKSKEAAVIDPGESYPVLREVEKYGVRLRHILCTHHHADHIGGISELLEENPAINIYGHEADKDRIPGITVLVNQYDTIEVGNLSTRVLYTPGHTRGSIMYSFTGALFTGDTLFGGGCGRLFEGSASQMYQALTGLSEFPDDTKVYFGHEYTVSNLKFAQFIEPDNRAVQKRLDEATQLAEQNRPTSPSNLFLELATNPFLRSDKEGIVKGLQGKCEGTLTDPLGVFTALRKLKDSF